MFRWLKELSGGGGVESLTEMTRDLERMIEEGSSAFSLATSALLDGVPADKVRDDLYRTDGRIDALEQSIRRRIVVHGSVHGSGHITELMTLMSVSKDAERIGDYAKNIFTVAAMSPASAGSCHHEHMVARRDEVAQLLDDAPKLYETQDRAKSQAFIDRASAAIDRCEEGIVGIIQSDEGSGHDAACLLAYRHMRRVLGHVQNIVTAVVNPIDKIDFHDEPRPA